MEDPARYLAGRIRSQYDVSPRATRDELLAVCGYRGAGVWMTPAAPSLGQYFPWPSPVILLPPTASARELGHELYHHLIRDNTAHGVEYGLPHWQEGDEEEAAWRFADLLCGE